LPRGLWARARLGLRLRGLWVCPARSAALHRGRRGGPLAGHRRGCLAVPRLPMDLLHSAAPHPELQAHMAAPHLLDQADSVALRPKVPAGSALLLEDPVRSALLRRNLRRSAVLLGSSAART